MEQNFNKLQSSLEKTPIAKPEAHFILNDIAKKYLSEEQLTADENNSLELLWDNLQSLDTALVSFLDNYRSNETISKNETLIVADFLLVAKQIGPDCEKIINSIYQQRLNLEQFSELALSISIPTSTRQVIINLYNKIISSKTSQV